MARLRRFHVKSLRDLLPGQELALSENEARHMAVLRLKSGAEIELFDDERRVARAELTGQRNPSAMIKTVCEQASKPGGIILAVAWPKGKRAAVLVEKCAELGAQTLIPVQFQRSVISKDEESQGLERLRRIAAEAAKQCGRDDVMEITEERSFLSILQQEQCYKLLLNPRAERHLIDIIELESDKLRSLPTLLVIGPEGGLSEEELESAKKVHIVSARLAENVLRIETAAIAACAIVQAGLRQTRKEDEL